MRRLVLLLLAAACANSPPLETGRYRLAARGGGSWTPDMNLLLDPAGSFTGNPVGDVCVCSGDIDPGEHEKITDALNDADALGRDDHRGGSCADGRSYRFQLQAVAGAAEGHANEFGYVPCGDVIGSIERLIEAVNAPIDARIAAGTCDACPDAADPVPDPIPVPFTFTFTLRCDRDRRAGSPVVRRPY